MHGVHPLPCNPHPGLVRVIGWGACVEEVPAPRIRPYPRGPRRIHKAAHVRRTLSLRWHWSMQFLDGGHWAFPVIKRNSHIMCASWQPREVCKYVKIKAKTITNALIALENAIHMHATWSIARGPLVTMATSTTIPWPVRSLWYSAIMIPITAVSDPEARGVGRFTQLPLTNGYIRNIPANEHCLCDCPGVTLDQIYIPLVAQPTTVVGRAQINIPPAKSANRFPGGVGGWSLRPSSCGIRQEH